MVYVALKNRLMNAYNKDWSLADASRLLKRFLDALDEDLPVVHDYISKIKFMLDEKADDPEFTRLHAFYLLSMCLSKPHQLVFDHQMRTLKETKRCAFLEEPFGAKIRRQLVETQKKFLTGTDKLVAYGDLSNKQKGLVKLYATKGIKPEQKKPETKPKPKPNSTKADKPKKPDSQPKPKEKEKEGEPTKKRFRKSRVTSQQKEAVVEAFDLQKNAS